MNNVPRVLGIALLVVAMVFHRHFGASVAAVVFAGMVLVVFDKRVSSAEFKSFLSSFRLDKRFVFVAFYDMLCLAVFFFLIPLFARYFTSGLSSAAASGDFLIALFLLFVYLAAVSLLLLAAYTVFKALVWIVILKKRKRVVYFKGLFVLNLAWWLVLLVPFAVLVFGLKPEYRFAGIIVFAVLYTHLTSLMHYSFINSMRVGRALSRAFALTFSNFRGFLLFYSYAVIVYFVLLQVFWFVPKGANIMLFVSLLFTVFFLAWYRLYLSRFLKRWA